MKYIRSFFLTALVISAVSAGADEVAPTPVRSVLERHEQAGVPNKEIILGSATLPPGSGIGFHTHPGDEAGYVLKGTLIIKVKGQADRVLKAGDHFFNPRGLVHSVVALPDGEGGVALSTWILDKDKPFATPVAN